MQDRSEAARAAPLEAAWWRDPLAALQRRLLYFPDVERPDASRAGVPGVQILTLRTHDGLDLLAWFTPAEHEAATILFLHGNAGSIANRAYRLARIAKEGLGVLMLEWRGYGGNPGRPSQEGFAQDADAGWEALRLAGVAAQRIAVWGESLGSAVALGLAGRRAIGTLILETPFTSIPDVAKHLFPPFLPVGFLARDRYDARAMTAAIRAPTLVMAGGRDRLVPPAMSHALFGALPGHREFWLAENSGHNDMAASGAIERGLVFIAEQTGSDAVGD